EVRPRAIGSFAVLSREHCVQAIWLGPILQGNSYSWTHATSGATADRVHDNHRCTTPNSQFAVHIGGSPQFLNAQSRELFAHRNSNNFWIHFFPSLLLFLKS